MNRGQDHVGWSFPTELDDPFPQVGLHHFQAFLFQVVVKEGLLRSHGLGFDNLPDAVVFGNGRDDLVGVLGGAGQVHLDARRLGLGLEGCEELF